MKVFILLSSMALVSAANEDPPPRSVNVNLETYFIFDPYEIENKLFINNVKGFLEKLSNILEPPNQRHFRTESETLDSDGSPNFIDTLKIIGTDFVNMPGGKIKEAVNTIHEEVVKIADNKKGLAKIEEVIPNEKMKTIIKDSIKDLIKSNPEEMKRMINSTMTEDSPLLKTFARRVNSYYNEEDVKKLNKILKKFKRNVENDIDNSKVIKELFHNAVFKKYNSLNESTKGALLSDLKMFSGFLVAKNMFSGLNENLSVLTRRNSPTQEGDTVNLHDADITYKALRRSIDKKLRDAREKKDEKIKDVKKDGAKSEIVVDKVEVLVEPLKNPVKL